MSFGGKVREVRPQICDVRHKKFDFEESATEEDGGDAEPKASLQDNSIQDAY